MYKNRLCLNIILAIWQLPQIITGLLLLIPFHRSKRIYTNPHNNISVLLVEIPELFNRACFSSGPIVFAPSGVAEETLKHETGHSKQSIYLGWVYHLVISIPSIIRFWYKSLCKKTSSWYFSGYPENWADKLGGVTR